MSSLQADPKNEAHFRGKYPFNVSVTMTVENSTNTCAQSNVHNLPLNSTQQ